MSHCSTNPCAPGTTAASANLTVQAIKDRRVNDAVNRVTCDIAAAARQEKRTVYFENTIKDLPYDEKSRVVEALRQRGFTISNPGYLPSASW